MREILFRAKKSYSKSWAMGSLARGEFKDYIVAMNSNYAEWCNDFQGCAWEVDPETIGQYTGLIDKNGVKIFEGDVIQGKWINADESRADDIIAVEYKNGGFYPFVEKTGESSGLLYYTKLNAADFCIIGNIHDNPELIK